MSRKTVIAALGCVLLLAAGFLPAQAPAPRPDQNEPVDPDLIIREQFNFVLVPVTVLDRNGNFVNGLSVLDFQLLDNGIPQKITEDVASRPISLVVVIQANASTRQILPTVQKSASLYGPLVAGETGEVAVLSFDHQVRTLTGFTSNQDEIKAAFEKLKPGGTYNHLDDAVMVAVRMLQNRGRERKKVVLIIAESRDQGSAVTPRDVLTQAEFADVVIYSVNMSHLLNQLTSKAEPNRPNPIPPEFRSPLPMGTIRTGTTDAQTNMGNWTPIIKEIYTAVKGIFVPNMLEIYTKETGGREHNFVSLSGLEEAISKIGSEIHSQYMLTYLPSNRHEGGYHEIQVRVARPDVEVRTRGGYWIAPSGPSQPAK